MWIEWEPTASAAVAKVATPPLNVPVPSVVAPSRKVTVPVAEEDDTVAVNVMLCPTVAGLTDDVNTVEVVI